MLQALVYTEVLDPWLSACSGRNGELLGGLIKFLGHTPSLPHHQAEQLCSLQDWMGAEAKTAKKTATLEAVLAWQEHEKTHGSQVPGSCTVPFLARRFPAFQWDSYLRRPGETSA